MPASTSGLADRLKTVPPPARKLFSVIVREAFHGPIHGKPEGVATPVEILEACGLDVDAFYSLLRVLSESGLISASGEYPFEEIRLSAEAAAARGIAERCTERNVPLEEAFVNLNLPLDS